MENNIENRAEDSANHDVKLMATHPVEFKFNGKAGEFFKIWIVNILLSILTLGIYSAWAKVRTNRYFQASTEVDNHSFSYLATPLQILKGRIIAVLLFGSYYVVSMISPIAGMAIMGGLLLAMPWLICASLRFKMRMTSYRNVRFDFTGKYGEAFLNFLVFPVISVFTLYLLFPYALKRMDQFIVNHTRYGDRQFKAELCTTTYYMTSIVTAVMGIAIFGLFALVIGMSATDMQADAAEGMQWMTIIIFAVYVLVFSFIQAFYITQIRNHIFASTELEDVATFKSNFTFTSLAVIQLTNMLALLCTLGLAFPWVKVRMMNYMVDRTEVHMNDNKEQVLDIISENNSAISEEVAEVFDVDVALV